MANLAYNTPEDTYLLNSPNNPANTIMEGCRYEGEGEDGNNTE